MDNFCEHKKSPIQNFYNNEVIFITGGTGFVGSGLIEKLLRTCPDIKKIYLLIRCKKGKKAEERLNELYNDEFFSKLKMQNPNFKDCLTIIKGDLIEKNMGLTDEDRNTIINEVTILFHVAATVRFDEALKKAAIINIQATKDILELCSKCKKLKSIVHISTAYSQCILPELEEKFYKPIKEPNKFLEFCEKYSEEELNNMTPNIIEPFPNTYTFTKSLAEELIRQYNKELPITVVRPSIIMGSWKEPVQGWVDNIYGPIGLMVGVGMGFIRVIYNKKTNKADVVPLDITVNAIIAVGYEISNRDYKNEDIIIYNVTSGKQNPIKWETLIDWTFKFGLIYASVHAIWAYNIIILKNIYAFKFFKFFLHTAPAYIVDAIFKMRGKKPMLRKIYEKIDKIESLLHFFSIRDWMLHDDNTKDLYNKLERVDKVLFPFDIKSLVWDIYLFHTIRLIRIHLLKDPLQTIPLAQKKMSKLNIVHYTVVFTCLILFFCFLIFLVRLFI